MKTKIDCTLLRLLKRCIYCVGTSSEKIRRGRVECVKIDHLQVPAVNVASPDKYRRTHTRYTRGMHANRGTSGRAGPVSNARYSGPLFRRFHNPSPRTIIMNSEGTFSRPDGDIILRATHGTQICNFRVHKLSLSSSSSVFRDMFRIPQPSSAPSNGADVIDVTDPPQALELVLRFIYASFDMPVIDDLSLLPEALAITDKYDIPVVRSRMRSLFKRFAVAEPLRAYAIACRLGLEYEMKFASSHTMSIHLPGLTELPPEFKLIPATEYHRLVLLHSRYRQEVAAIANHFPVVPPMINSSRSWARSRGNKRRMAIEATRKHFVNCIMEGVPLNHRSLTLSMKAGNNPGFVSDNDVRSSISSILSQASALNLTV
jgi:hypothetical protein